MSLRIFIIILIGFMQLNSFALRQLSINQDFNCKLTKNKSKNKLISEPDNLKNTKSLNTISGFITAGINPLPKGRIYLLKNKKSTFSTIKYEEVLEGNFKFSDVNLGDYFLYVIPELNYDFLFFPKYIPTYLGKTYAWQKASINSTNRLNINFNLLSYQNPFYGNKLISGHLIFKGSYRGINNLPVPVILLDEYGNPMDFRIIDEYSGNFSFDYLPEGIYYIHPEIPGLKTYDYRIEIKSENESDKFKNLNFLVTDENIKIEKDSEEIISVVSNRFLKIFLKQNICFPVICELIDLSGKSVAKNIYYSDNILMNTSGMAANLYILKVKTYDNSPVKTTKVFIRNY